jgi:hypothetical protein
MVLPKKIMADWGPIEQQRQKEMGRNNRRTNASRIGHDYNDVHLIYSRKVLMLIVNHEELCYLDWIFCIDKWL